MFFIKKNQHVDLDIHGALFGTYMNDFYMDKSNNLMSNYFIKMLFNVIIIYTVHCRPMQELYI